MAGNLERRNPKDEIRNAFYFGTLTGHAKYVTKICTHRPDRNIIISTAADGAIHVWKLSLENRKITGSVILSMEGHAQSITDCSLSRYYELIATSSWDKTVKIWDVNTGDCQRTYKGLTSEVLSVTFDDVETRIISGSKDNSIRVWDVYSDKISANTTAHSAPVTCLSMLKDKITSTFISTSEKGEIFEWNLLKLALNEKYMGHRGKIYSISVSDDSTKMIVGGKGEEVTTWDIGNYDRCHRFIVLGEVRSVSISPLYHIVAIGQEEKLLLYHFGIFSPYQTIIPKDVDRKNPPKVTALCWSDNAKYIYVGYTDCKIRVYRMKLFFFPCDKNAFLSPDSPFYK